MKLLVAAIILTCVYYSNVNSSAINWNTIRDTTKWRLVLLESISSSGEGSDRFTMDFRDKKTMMYLRFINDKQVVAYFVFQNYKPDTATFSKSKDTLFIDRYRSGKMIGRDSFLVRKQSADSLVLNQVSYRGSTILRFSSKDLSIKGPEEFNYQLSAGFFENATKWKMISSETKYTYRNDPVLNQFRTSSSSINMLDKVNSKNEIFLFLSKDVNDTIVVSGGIYMGIRDTVFYRKSADTIITRPLNADTMLIIKHTQDSLILLSKSRDSVKFPTTTFRYVKAGAAN